MNILSVLLQAQDPAIYKLNYDEHYLISVPLATNTTPGVASFKSAHFNVNNGEVSIKLATTSAPGIASFLATQFDVTDGVVSIKLATTSTPGIASFDEDYFSVDAGMVSLSTAFVSDLNNIVTRLVAIEDAMPDKLDKIVPNDRGTFAYIVTKGPYDSVTNSTLKISDEATADTLALRSTDGRLKVGDGVANDDAVNKGQLTNATTDIPKTALASDVKASLDKADSAYQLPDTGIPENVLSVDVRTKLNKVISRVAISPEDWEDLPDADKDINTMYFVGPYGTYPNEYYVEYMYFVDEDEQGHWEAIGSTQAVDLSGYLPKQTGTSTYIQFYTKGTDGSQSMTSATSSSVSSTAVMRDANGRYQAEAPTADKDVVNKESLEDGTVVPKQSLNSNSSLSTKAIAPLSEESGTIHEVPFISQGTGTANNTASVDTSPVAKQLEKQGYTVASNQLIEIANSHAYTRTGASTTAAYSADYRKVTITFTGDQTDFTWS